MTPDLKLLCEMTEREFRGHTFNGQSLMETLRPLTATQASDRKTVEGYSAWDNLIHCVFFKYVVVRFLGASAPCDPYPWAEGSFPVIPDVSEEAWKRALDYAELVHDTYMAALKVFDVSRLDEPFAPWQCTLGEALIWIPPHDTYHVAQVRSMGLAAFWKPRKPVTEGY